MTIDRRLFLAGAASLTIAPAAIAAARPAPGVTELRQYTLKGGKRADFTRLFEQNFIASQEAVGAEVLGIFRDLDDPDRFVWMRGFADMDARKAALEAFYYGPVWKAHRAEANAMIVDSDNVLLLRPLTGADALTDPPPSSRPGLIRVAIQRLRDVDPSIFANTFAQAIQPHIEAAGGRTMATLITETAANNFPRLPVREHDSVLVWIARFPDEVSERAFTRKLSGETGWRDVIADALLPALMQKPEVLRLAPIRASHIR
jgi:quinol monooxygenase YgiN